MTTLFNCLQTRDLMFTLPKAGSVTLVNHLDKRYYIIASNNLFIAIAKEFADLRDGKHMASFKTSLKEDILNGNIEMVLTDRESPNGRVAKAKAVGIDTEYTAKGYTPYVKKRIAIRYIGVRYRPIVPNNVSPKDANLDMNDELKRLRQSIEEPIIQVELITARHYGHVVGVFPTLNEAQEYVLDTYPEGSVLYPKFATNGMTKEYFRLLREQEDKELSYLSDDEIAQGFDYKQLLHNNDD